MRTALAFGLGWLCIAGASACARATVIDGKTPVAADAVYYGGPIITMIRDGDQVEALAVRDGRIIATGREAEIMELRGPETALIDLDGRCLMPGFIDPHSHIFTQSVKFATIDLDPYPIGDIRTIGDIQAKLRKHMADKSPKPDQWILGWGYDDTAIEEHRHPTRDDLDAVSTEHAIVLVHISSHLMTANSKALELAGISAETPDPEGGVIQRRPGSREPNGVLEEHAMKMMLAKVPPPSPERLLDIFEAGLAYYAAAGITTAQDGATPTPVLELFRQLDAQGRMPIDVVAYPVSMLGADEDTVAQIAEDWMEMKRFRVGGIKAVLDGSLQGYTGYLSEPYHVQPGQGEIEGDACTSDAMEQLFLGDEQWEEHDEDEAAPGEGYRGYPNMTVDQVRRWIRLCDDAGIQLLAHTNGDAATDILIEAIGAERADRPRPDLRTVIIHAQTMREDQLDFAANQGLIPSFFPIHVTYWGDRHRDIFLGPSRAARISPSRSALDRGMKITLHHDAPVAGISMLNVVEAAVTRVTSSGKVLGPEQRITAYEAFRAITKDAAYQYFEEHRKGTLEPGKLADMVLLDADPFAVAPDHIGEIKVLRTIKEGNAIYDAE